MDAEKFIHSFMDAFQRNVPPALSGLGQVLRDHVKMTLEQVLAKMDIISREEFDVQVALLRRANEKLLRLEERMLEMDAGKGVSDEE